MVEAIVGALNLTQNGPVEMAQSVMLVAAAIGGYFWYRAAAEPQK